MKKKSGTKDEYHMKPESCVWTKNALYPATVLWALALFKCQENWDGQMNKLRDR